MSDLKVRVKYHEIEVEVILPMDGIGDYKPSVEHKMDSVMKILKESTKQIETLIITGRRDNNV